MVKIITKSCLIFIFFLTSNCGYKALDNSRVNNFHVIKIETSGNKRINFKIKNNLKIYSPEDTTDNLILEIYTEKNKKIKEKNIKNEITKYEISLSSNVKLNFLENNKEKEFIVLSAGDYKVGDKYSTTLNNEKRLIEDLTNNISNQIKNKINLILNDF